MSETRISRALRGLVAIAVALSAVAALSPAAPSHATEPPPADAVAIVPLTPARLLDTRSGLGAPAGKVGPDGVIELDVTDVGGVPADEVGAVVLNVTVTEPTAASFVTVWPTGEARPVASSLNMLPGDTVPNLVIAKVGVGGTVSLFNRFGETHLVADVMAWIPEGVAYGALQPERLLDTRSGLGAPTGPVGPGGVVQLQVVGHGGVPHSGAGSVVLNVTVTEPTAPSFVTVWPSGVDQPGTSSLNMVPGETVPNLVISRIGADGNVLLANRFGTTHLVADVVGWIPDGAGFTGITPARVLDTRTDGAGALGPDTTRALGLGGAVPADATAVALNVTITEPTAATFITAWPAGVERPTASSLNAVPGQTRPAMVIVKLGTDQTVNLFNRFGSSHLVADLVGWYATPTKVPMSLAIDQALAPATPALEPGRPLSVLAEGDVHTDFVNNELLVVAPPAAAQQIAAEFHGTILSSVDSLDGLDPIHTIRFDLAAVDPATLPTVAATLEALASIGEPFGAAYRLSDSAGVVLLQILGAVLADGITASINPTVQTDFYTNGSILEEPFDANRNRVVDSNETHNAFGFEYLREGGGMDHGFTSAWQELEHFNRLRPAVKVAVWDGGFFSSADQAPMNMVGADYNEQNPVNCSGGNPCPWHGTGVVDTIFATHDNKLGTAGGATPVISEMVAIGLGDSVREVLVSIVEFPIAVHDAELLNISAGFRVPVGVDSLLRLILDPIVAGFQLVGPQLVVSAGNSSNDVDSTDCFIVCWEDDGWLPCEISGVMCVGGLKLGTTDADPGSNYGHENVDIWASYTVKVGPAPEQTDFQGKFDIRKQTVNGTSFSAPLVTAAAALVIGANPSLGGSSALDRLVATARPGTGRVGRILDVQQAVHSAFAAQRFVEIYAPKPATTIMYKQQLTLAAHACCVSGGAFTWFEGPRNGTLTQFATGSNPAVTFDRPPGPRTLEVRWTVGGTTRTDRIDYTLTNQAPVVSVQRPFANEQFFESDIVPLRATATDETVVLPDSAFTWRIDGNVVANAKQFDVSGLTVGAHTAMVTVTDGNMSTSVSRNFTVLEDPENPVPVVAIFSPTTDESTGCPGYLPNGDCQFQAAATSSDTGPGGTPQPAPTIIWSYQKVGTAGETDIGNTDSGESITVTLPTADLAPCTTPWEFDVFARVSDGTTIRTDVIRINPGNIIC